LDAAEWVGRFIEASSPQGIVLRHRLRLGWFRALCRAAERCMISGLALHQVLRKRCLERTIPRALADGFAQVVVLGGGFDSLALRLHRDFPAVDFLDLDHAATQRIKKSVIDKFGGAGPNLHLAAVDLDRQPLDGVLTSLAEYKP